jgi:hypothetical protein
MEETYEKNVFFHIPWPASGTKDPKPRAPAGGMGKPRGGDDFHVENQWICFFGDFQKMMIVPLDICRDFQIEEKTYVIAMKSTNGYPKGYFMGDITNGMLIWVCPKNGETLHVASFSLRKAMINQRISADSDKPIRTFFRGKFHFEYGYNEIYHQNLRDLTSICFIGHLH